jgi:glycine/D-amino acid oxidase-like deaminating enzyme
MAGPYFKPKSHFHEGGLVAFLMPQTIESLGHKARRPTSGSRPLTLGDRLCTAFELARRLNRHDPRAARTFLRRTYPDAGWVSLGVRFAGWLWRQCWTDIPRTWREISFEKPVSNTPLWLAEGNPFASYPWIRNPGARLPEHADVVVIGAGFTGGSLAYHWAKSGTAESMVVLEMGDPASGASGRNAGEVVMGRYFALVFSTVRRHLPHLRPDLSPPSIDRLARQFAAAYCKAAYHNADLVEKTIRQEGFDCDYVREGWVQERSAQEQTALDETVRMGLENGFGDWDKLSAEEASRKTGAHLELPANYSRRAARFHPAKWVWSLFDRALASNAVQLFTRTKVLTIVDQDDEYRVMTDRGTIRARHVVNATEAYTANLLERFRGVVEARQSQAAYGLDEGRSVKPNVPFSGSTFFCLRHRNGILFGSDETPIPNAVVGRNMPSRFITAFVAAQLRMKFGPFPLRVTNEWAGSVGFTPDEYPLVGLIDGKRHYLVAGMSGSGTAVSFNAGRCLCGRILGQTHDDDYPPEYFAPSRLLDPASHVWPELQPQQGTA